MTESPEQYGEGEKETIVQHGPGHDLKLARESLGIAVDDVAQQLRLAPGVIRALENDEYGKIAPIYVCGYLRKYAKLTGLSESRIVAQYESVSNDVDEPPVLADVIVRSRPKKNSKLLATSTLIIIVSLATLVALWWKSNGTMPESLTETMDVEGNDVASQVPALQDDVLLEYTQVDIPESTVLSPESVLHEQFNGQELDLPDAEPVPGDSMQKTVELPPEPETAAGENTRPPSAEILAGDQPATVTMKFSDDSWAELIDASGQRLMFDLFTRGREQSVTGKPPFTILLGNASGVTLEYNGQPVPMERYIRPSGTANFVLGAANSE
jgi:cytoskeleton protein RodZ